jgi:hypothetical protein
LLVDTAGGAVEVVGAVADCVGELVEATGFLSGTGRAVAGAEGDVVAASGWTTEGCCAPEVVGAVWANAAPTPRTPSATAVDKTLLIHWLLKLLAVLGGKIGIRGPGDRKG